jgi:uncharacterized protein (DUF1800 family)
MRTATSVLQNPSIWQRLLARLAPGLVLGALAVLSQPLLAQTGDILSNSNFENPSDGPFNDIEAARFLTQATFGPTRAEIARLRQLGYRAWINEQLAMAPTLTRPWLLGLEANTNFMVNSGHRVDRWSVQAVSAPDQLRQRMAYALGQILVVSDSTGIDVREIAEYQDMMTSGAFNTYRTLLGQVTYSPMMGKWLTYVRSRAQYSAGTPPSTVLPDENYAREVMQLFSFGLIKRNPDFSPTTNPPTPTYDNTTIANMSRVFTGLTFTGSTSFYNSTGGSQFNSMTCLPMTSLTNTNFLATGVTYHDLLAKPIFDGLVIPAVTTNTEASCLTDINAVLDQIAVHATVAPNISRQLIQRFVTSNPSPAYIGRISAVFANNGAGVRGDLGAVIRAILLDDEARRLPRANEGKLREPLLRLTAAWRALDVELGVPEPAMVNTPPVINNSVGNVNMRIGNSFSEFGQRPWSAPTVFNFYQPDYQNPGALDAADLYSPEFQILNETTVARVNNQVMDLAAARYSGRSDLVAGVTTSPRVQLDTLAAPLATYNAMTQAALIDELNLRLMNGYMSNPMRQTLLTMLAATPAPANTDDARRIAVRNVLRVIYVSPEFAVQK